MTTKIAYKGATYDVHFTTSWVNYNCSLKMVGRLKLNGAPEDFKYNADWRALLDQNKDNLIHDWVASLENRNTFPQLKEGNPIFPHDSGVYLPSVILYSDAVNGDYTRSHWAYAFTPFLEQLKDPKYGCTIVDLPGYHNRTYSIYNEHPRFCKVWAIYPPPMADKVFTPANPKLRPEFRSSTTGITLPEPYRSEVRRAISG